MSERNHKPRWMSHKIGDIHTDAGEAPKKRQRRSDEEESRDRDKAKFSFSVEELLDIAPDMSKGKKKKLRQRAQGPGIKQGQRVPLNMLVGMRKKQKQREDDRHARIMELSEGVMGAKKKTVQKKSGEARGMTGLQRGKFRGGVLYVEKSTIRYNTIAAKKAAKVKRRQKGGK